MKRQSARVKQTCWYEICLFNLNSCIKSTSHHSSESKRFCGLIIGGVGGGSVSGGRVGGAAAFRCMRSAIASRRSMHGQLMFTMLTENCLE